MVKLYAGAGIKTDTEAEQLLVKKLHESKEEREKAKMDEPFFTLQAVKNGLLKGMPGHYAQELLMYQPANVSMQIRRMDEHLHIIIHPANTKPENGAEYRVL